MFLPAIWEEIFNEMGRNSCNIYVTEWFIIITDEKKWKDKPLIHGELSFWIYLVRLTQKFFSVLLQTELSIVGSGGVKIGEKTSFLMLFCYVQYNDNKRL